MPEREMTYGEKAVGLRFNPSGDDKVAKAKKLCAQLIDMMNELREEKSEQARLASVAITEMQAAQMRAVKALTRRD